jgi:hypothetical protein
VYGRDYSDEVKTNNIGELNQIDSLTEYVAEIVLDHKNAFPENGANSHHTSAPGHLAKHISIKMVSFKKIAVLSFSRSSQPINIPSKEEYKNMFSREIVPPPPKA